MLRFAMLATPMLAVAATACGLEALSSEHGGQGGHGAACAARAVVSDTRSSFTTNSVEPEDVLSLTLPGGAAPHGWITLLSARLAGIHQVLYSIDGTPRGLGESHSLNDVDTGGGGPWQAFDFVSPAAGDRVLSVQFRTKNAQVLATIEDLHLVAFAVPNGADLMFVDLPERQTIVQPSDESNRVFQPVASLEIASGPPGDYLVMLGLVGTESPGIASIGVKALAPGADEWPVASATKPRPYLSTAIDDWQSFTLLRSVPSDGTMLKIELQVDASSTNTTTEDQGSEIQYVRALAMRQDSFASVATATAVEEEQTIYVTDDTAVSELDVAAGDPCRRLVVAQFVTMHVPREGEHRRHARFAGAGATFDHEVGGPETKLAYGSFAVLPPEPVTLTNFVAASDGRHPVSVRESVIVALDVPGVSD